MSSSPYSPVNVARGALTEYTNASNPLELNFEFNPTTITRTRTVEFGTGQGQGDVGGYDFGDESTVPVVAQTVTVKPESFTIKILLDATYRMEGGKGAQVQPPSSNQTDAQAEATKKAQEKDRKKAQTQGVQPELDILRSMMEPKLQAAGGANTLAALGQGDDGAVPYASVLLFVWGQQVLPVFMTQAQFEVKAYLPNLLPYRAEATLTLQMIESNNPFYMDELQRQFSSAEQAIGGEVQGYQSSGIS